MYVIFYDCLEYVHKSVQKTVFICLYETIQTNFTSLFTMNSTLV